MARRREPAQALPGTASRQVPTKHVPARLAPGGATPAETRRRGVRRTGRIRTELYSNLQAFSATLESYALKLNSLYVFTHYRCTVL